MINYGFCDRPECRGPGGTWGAVMRQRQTVLRRWWSSSSSDLFNLSGRAPLAGSLRPRPQTCALFLSMITNRRVGTFILNSADLTNKSFSLMKQSLQPLQSATQPGGRRGIGVAQRVLWMKRQRSPVNASTQQRLRPKFPQKQEDYVTWWLVSVTKQSKIKQ